MLKIVFQYSILILVILFFKFNLYASVCETYLSSNQKTERLTLLNLSSSHTNLKKLKRSQTLAFVQNSLSQLVGFDLPDSIDISIVEKLGSSRAFSDVLNGSFRVLSVLDDAILLHEIGHLIFDLSLLNRGGVFYAQTYREFKIEFEAAKSPDPIGTENRYYIIRQKYDKLRRLTLSYTHMIHAEFFADTLTLAFTGDPRCMVNSLSDEYEPTIDALSVNLRARDFSENVDFSDWKNEDPYNDVHNFLGPSRYIVGKAMRNKSLKTRLIILELVFQALSQNIEYIASEGNFNSLPNSTRTDVDILKANDRLILVLRKFLAQYIED